MNCKKCGHEIREFQGEWYHFKFPSGIPYSKNCFMDEVGEDGKKKFCVCFNPQPIEKCTKCGREIREFNLAKDEDQEPIMEWCHWTKELGIISYTDCPEPEREDADSATSASSATKFPSSSTDKDARPSP